MAKDRSALPTDPRGQQYDWSAAALAARPLLVSVARRVVRDAREAEDSADEALARLSREFATNAGVADVVGWLHRTTIRIAVDRARSWMRRNRPEWLNEVGRAKTASPLEAPEGPAERKELRERVWREVLRLPARQREVVVLRQMEGASYRDIAGRLGISEATARAHAHAGRESLRRRLAGVAP